MSVRADYDITPALLETLCRIAEEAGRAILAVYAGEVAAWTKADDSPLTEADLRADAVIQRGLGEAFAGVVVLSEESARLPAAPAHDFLLVDPLDGTKEFLKRNGEFTVNIAWIRAGVPIAGVVGAPALGEMFFGAAGLGAWKRDAQGTARLGTRPPPPGAALRVIGSRSHAGEAMGRWLQALEQPHSFVAAGSSLKFCRIAEGQADIYPRLGPTCQWDTAAGQAVLEAAGGAVFDPDGQPLRYGLDRPALNRYFVAVAAPHLRYPPLD